MLLAGARDGAAVCQGVREHGCSCGCDDQAARIPEGLDGAEIRRPKLATPAGLRVSCRSHLNYLVAVLSHVLCRVQGDNRAAQALLLVDECATALRAVGSRVRLTPASAQSRPSLRGAEGLGIAFEGRGDAEILVEVQLTAPPQAVAAHPPLGRVWVPPRLLTVDP